MRGRKKEISIWLVTENFGNVVSFALRSLTIPLNAPKWSYCRRNLQNKAVTAIAAPGPSGICVGLLSFPQVSLFQQTKPQ
jgi:hypothetical protein